MSTPAHLYQLFAPAQSIESAIAAILESQGMSAQVSFEKGTNTTPRVELQVILGEPVHQVSPMVRQFSATNAQMQPFDTWGFNALATVVTERTQNGIYHVELIQKTRYNFQYFRLKETLTTSVSPYHTISMIAEVNQQDTVDDEKNCQMSQLTFKGILNIRESAWS